MRVLLDECVDERLRFELSEFDCSTARFAGLAGLKNGALLAGAERSGFAAIVTVDQNIPDQQDLRNRAISLVVLCGRTNRLADLKPLVSAAAEALSLIQPGQIVVIRA